MLRVVRFVQFLIGLLMLFTAVGFFIQANWALDLWPWAGTYTGLSRLSAVFLSSILAAAAVPVLWVSLSGEQRGAEAGALELAVTFGGIGLFMFQSYSASGNNRALNGVIFYAVIFIMTVGFLLYSRTFQPRDTRPLPGPVRVSFAVFAVVLFLAGTAMVLKRPGIFPWTLTTEMSVVYGWIFLGAMVYFVHAVVRPGWHNATGQLLGFLAYDVVLIVPFIQHFSTVDPELRMNLIIYVAILVFSGGLAAYYLFINPATRLWKARQPEGAVTAAGA
jgi:hypothetical protein